MYTIMIGLVYHYYITLLRYPQKSIQIYFSYKTELLYMNSFDSTKMIKLLVFWNIHKY